MNLDILRVAGAPPTLVFLHEGLGSAAQWRELPARLARATGRATLAYSRAGYGRSPSIPLPRPLTYMHDEARDTLPAILRHERIDEHILVGHSDGASIALVYAGTPSARRPGLRGLALLAPHVFVEDVSVRSIAAAREAFERGNLRAALARHHDDPDAAFWGWNRAWLDPGFRSWNLEAYLPAIDVPLLLIQGEDDPYGTLAQLDAIERGVAAGTPITRLVLPACGHAPQRDRPEETFAALEAFVTARS